MKTKKMVILRSLKADGMQTRLEIAVLSAAVIIDALVYLISLGFVMTFVHKRTADRIQLRRMEKMLAIVNAELARRAAEREKEVLDA